ncbi:hypothetical protein B0T26DRAFT_601917, partial [Lasiosphaeria miniovina]
PTRTTPPRATEAKRRKNNNPEPRSGRRKRKPATLWSDEESAQLMLWFLDCTRLRYFAAERSYRQAWDHVLEQSSQLWPQKLLTKDTISTKYFYEKKRWRALNELMTSGTSFTPDGLPDVSDEVWERYWARNGRRNRWLATKPIGDYDVYAEVFKDDRSTGEWIREPADIIRARNEQQEEETNQSGDAEDEEEVDEQGSPAPASQPRPARLTSTQQRRLDTDPDLHHARPVNTIQPEAAIVVPRQAQRGREKQTEATRLADGMIEAAAIVAAPKPVGAEDVAMAMEDIERRYKSSLTLDNLFNCSEYLCRWPVKATIYLRAGPELKARYLKEWKKG